jgi:hypothetical protein
MIHWGFIGCGSVTEKKSGPAFSKIEGSEVVAVMRRDGEKARDYALRHGIGKWYDNADQLIHDPDVEAVYVATPPGSHAEYAIAAMKAGKPVYIEKPMAASYASASKSQSIARNGSTLFRSLLSKDFTLFHVNQHCCDDGALESIVYQSICYRLRADTTKITYPGGLERNCGAGYFYDWLLISSIYWIFFMVLSESRRIRQITLPDCIKRRFVNAAFVSRRD